MVYYGLEEETRSLRKGNDSMGDVESVVKGCSREKTEKFVHPLKAYCRDIACQNGLRIFNLNKSFADDRFFARAAAEYPL